MRREQHRQRDLFEPPRTPAALSPLLQSKLAPLLQELLREAAGVEHTAGGQREIGDDSDHA
jgi:hypothetical protein